MKNRNWRRKIVARRLARSIEIYGQYIPMPRYIWLLVK